LHFAFFKVTLINQLIFKETKMFHVKHAVKNLFETFCSAKSAGQRADELICVSLRKLIATKQLNCLIFFKKENAQAHSLYLSVPVMASYFYFSTPISL
jgi:hypothetical protein